MKEKRYTISFEINKGNCEEKPVISSKELGNFKLGCLKK